MQRELSRGVRKTTIRSYHRLLVRAGRWNLLGYANCTTNMQRSNESTTRMHTRPINSLQAKRRLQPERGKENGQMTRSQVTSRMQSGLLAAADPETDRLGGLNGRSATPRTASTEVTSIAHS